MSLFSVSKVFAQSPEEIIGEINVPKGVNLINEDAGGGIGIVLFLSNLITFIIILGGIWAFMNLILAGLLYLTGGGKADTHSKVSSKFTMSIIGLILMIVAYTVAALVGLIFYGDPKFILEPTVTPIGG